MTNKDIILFQKGNPDLPGASWLPGGYHFCASFRDPESASLHLQFPEQEQDIVIPMREGARKGNFAAVFVPMKKQKGLSYYYSQGGQNITDPYAKIVYSDGRCGIPSVLKPLVGKPENAPEDLIFYKLHVRGFTKNDPILPKELRGTFAGLTKKIRYLSSLGINAAELMPVYSFDAVLPNGKPNYWGFSENNYYFAPNIRYSATSDPVSEFRLLINKLHEAGIQCVLDFYIPETASIRTIQDALRYWTYEMGADGFHLSGKYAAIEEILEDPYLADRILLLDSPVQAVSERQRFDSANHVYCMQHDFRSVARKLLAGKTGVTVSFTEWFRCCPAQYHVINYICDHNGFTLHDLVSYNEKHNEANGEHNQDGSWENDSWNCGEEGPASRRSIIALRKRQVRNALMLVFLSQGIPLLYAGDEFGNSQDGNNNAYCLDNESGWLDWGSASANRDLTRFVKDLIQFRKEHGILHTGYAMWGSDYKDTGLPDISFHSREQFRLDAGVPAGAVLYNGDYARNQETSLFAAINAWEKPYIFSLPQLPDGRKWKTVLTSAREKSIKDFCGTETLTLPPHTVVVLEGV